MLNDERPDPDEGWRLKQYGQSVPIRVGRKLLGGPADGLEANWAPHFATVIVPLGEKRLQYLRREFVRAGEDALSYRQVAVFWCCPDTPDADLTRLAEERWP